MLLIFNAAAWLWAIATFRHQPVLLGTALLAYTFGLRHAVDADHIAAIDNVTRKLLQEKRCPLAVGWYFSAGHSMIVIAMSVGVAVATSNIQSRFAALKAMGAVISPLISAFFLLALAIANLLTLKSVVASFRALRLGEVLNDDDIDVLLNQRGFLARIFRPVFALVSKSWHLYPIGFLFGLSFDTATEVALFGISANQASHGTSVWSILVLPVLFAAGMSLVDTADGILMTGAYRWALTNPLRKLYYNMSITLASVVVAVTIGSVELLGLVSSRFGWSGAMWDIVGELNDHFSVLGYWIISLFFISWIGSIVVYRIRAPDVR
ncbi:HoxN/HupN/NixA family nickel/cobalt transporter [Paraburkholderia sacchari]|uniref:HoxN/HupN/NixA family nickel/cobalt transporter n=1 Tax=Paraburkholderia sacchari TaxID=159450 RepID=UPI0039A498CD